MSADNKVKQRRIKANKVNIMILVYYGVEEKKGLKIWWTQEDPLSGQKAEFHVWSAKESDKKTKLEQKYFVKLSGKDAKNLTKIPWKLTLVEENDILNLEKIITNDESFSSFRELISTKK